MSSMPSENAVRRSELLLSEMQDYVNRSTPFSDTQVENLLAQLDTLKNTIMKKTLTKNQRQGFKPCPICAPYGDAVDLKRCYSKKKLRQHQQNFHVPNFDSMDDIWTEYFYYEEEQYDKDGKLQYIIKKLTEKEAKDWHCDDCRVTVKRDRKTKHPAGPAHTRNLEIYLANREFKFADQEVFMMELVDLFIEKWIPLQAYKDLSLFLTKYTARCLPHSVNFRKAVNAELDKLPTAKKALIEKKIFVKGDRLPGDEFPRQKTVLADLKRSRAAKKKAEQEMTEYERMLQRAEKRYRKRQDKDATGSRKGEPKEKRKKTEEYPEESEEEFPEETSDSEDESTEESPEDEDYETSNSQDSSADNEVRNAEVSEPEMEDFDDFGDRDFLAEISSTPTPGSSSNDSFVSL